MFLNAFNVFWNNTEFCFISWKFVGLQGIQLCEINSLENEISDMEL
jgi:hypothetical protein